MGNFFSDIDSHLQKENCMLTNRKEEERKKQTSNNGIKIVKDYGYDLFFWHLISVSSLLAMMTSNNKARTCSHSGGRL